MTNKIPLLLACLIGFQAAAQSDSVSAVADIKAFQEKLTSQFKNKDESPLDPADFNSFEGHDFYPIDLDYRVNAKLEVTEGTPYFGMKTTTSRISTERIYGYLSFKLVEKVFRLPVYQSKNLSQTAEYRDYLFFPFTDETNGETTYDGGRYLDLRIPKNGDSLIVDFNKSYNPYCAYSGRYSCPIVPAENQIDIAIPAGVKHHKKEKLMTPELHHGDTAISMVADIQPEYPGGYHALTTFIGSNMHYPKPARRRNIQGIVYVQFIVEADGSISSVKTLKGISAECDAEAERVVRMMPKWTPGENDGSPVAVRFVLPIAFKLR